VKAALGLCALLLSAAAGVRAQPALELDVADCAGVSGSSVRELVALELAPVQPNERVAVSCRAEVAEITVHAAGRSALQLALSLRDIEPRARARSLALAVSELVATSRLQRPQPSASVPVQAPDEPDKGQLDAHIYLGLGIGRLTEPSLLAGSVAAGVALAWRMLAIAADVRFEHAQSTRSEAQIALNAGSFALAPLWRLTAPSAELALGPALRIGYASMHADARADRTTGLSVGGVWLAPGAQLGLRLRFTRRWSLRLGAEVAYVTRRLRGLDASGDPLLELRGVAIAAHLGVSWDAVSAR
jgi:hypothetical protein